MGPHAVIWQPTPDCPDVKAWLEEKGIKPHPGWVIKEGPNGSYSHEQPLAMLLSED